MAYNQYDRKKDRQEAWNTTMFIMIFLNFYLASLWKDLRFVIMIYLVLMSIFFLIWTLGNFYFVIWFRNFKKSKEKRKDE